MPIKWIERKKIKEATDEYRNLESKMLSELKKESDAKMKEILEDINDYIKEYAKTKSFDIILNKGAVLFGSDKIDLTSVILNKLNKEYTKK